jgi:DNA-directed RNA polymerase subunit RPC12/RpoP
MAVNTIQAQCPNCGAALNIEEGCKDVFCDYCGSKVLLHNENEASVKQAETDRMVRMKQMELADKKYADALKTKALKIK